MAGSNRTQTRKKKISRAAQRRRKKAYKQLALLCAIVVLAAAAALIVPRLLRGTPAASENVPPEPDVVADNEITFTVNGISGRAEIQPDVEELLISWQSSGPVGSWQISVADEWMRPLGRWTYDADVPGVRLPRSMLGNGQYYLTVSASNGSAQTRQELILLGAHDVLAADLSISRKILASIREGKAQIQALDIGSEDERPELGDVWQSWTNLVQIAAGSDHVVALQADGTVVGAGSGDGGVLGCVGLDHVRYIAASDASTACVLDTGAVRLYGAFGDAYGELSQQKNVDRLSISHTHVLVLYRDGTVRAFALRNEDAPDQTALADWSDVKEISAGYGYSLGLTSSGAVLYAGDPALVQSACAGWSGIRAIAAGNGYALAVTADGKVLSAVSAGLNFVRTETWEDIIAVAAGYYGCAGMHADGTVEFSGL